VNLVDEQDVAVLEICQQRGEVAGFRDDRAGGSAEVDAQFAREDLRERGFAEAGRPDEQHVVECFAPRPRRRDEDFKIRARLLLADELGKELRPQRRLGRVVLAALGRDEAARTRHFASSFSPRRMRSAASAPSPAARLAAATAAAACG